MGALTLSRLVALEALRRPRAVLASIMLALAAGFVILPNPSAPYVTLSFKGHPMIYTPAVMGFIAGGEFVAFAILLCVLAMSALMPMRAWRSVIGVAAAPSWKIALGLWIAGFGVGLFLLTCIFGGALLRASGVLTASGDWPGALWIFFTWTYGLGVVGAALGATVASVVALRLATRPALLMGATFILWIVVLAALISGGADVAGHGFGLAHLFPQTQREDFSMGFIFNAHRKAGIEAQPLGDLASIPGGGAFLLSRLALVLAALAAAIVLAGPRVKPLVSRSRNARALAAFGSNVSARFGLTGVIASQVWSAPLWAFAALAAAIGAETIYAGTPGSVIALGFAWGLYMLRWPELTEAFEHGALRSLVVPSVMGPWPIRLQIGFDIAVQMSLIALPLVIALAATGRVHGLEWLATQIALAPLLCLALARLPGGATAFSLLAMLWWYVMISGNAAIPAG